MITILDHDIDKEKFSSQKSYKKVSLNYIIRCQNLYIRSLFLWSHSKVARLLNSVISG